LNRPHAIIIPVKKQRDAVEIDWRPERWFRSEVFNLIGADSMGCHFFAPVADVHGKDSGDRGAELRRTSLFGHDDVLRRGLTTGLTSEVLSKMLASEKAQRKLNRNRRSQPVVSPPSL